MGITTGQVGARNERRRCVRSEAGEILEVRLRQRGRVTHGLFRRDGAVRLDRQRQPVVVGALTNARLGDGEVRAANRIVNRIDTDYIDWQRLVDDVLVGFDIAASTADVPLDGELAVTLDREQVLGGVDHRAAPLPLDASRRYGACCVLRDAQYGVLDALVERERERLEI